MRLGVAITLTVLSTLLILSLVFLTWGVLKTPWGWMDESSGWECAAPVRYVTCGCLDVDFLDNNLLIAVATGLFVIGVWLRTLHVFRFPKWLIVALPGFGLLQIVAGIAYFESGKAVELTGPRSQDSWATGEAYLSAGMSVVIVIGSIVFVRTLRSNPNSACVPGESENIVADQPLS